MAAGRGVVVTDSLMTAETWSVVVDHSLERKALLWDPVEKRPRDLWAYVYDDPTAGDLLYPPLQLTSVEGDEEGLVIGGVGILVDLGSNGIGPTIIDREYVSGANKLSNASFDLDDLYWVRAADGSMWVLTGGVASNVGGLQADDALEYDYKFPTRPGHAYRATAVGLTGTGRIRVRTIYEGRFHPADLLVNGGFESGAGVGWAAATNLAIVASGARTGTYAMRVSPIPKPQLISGSEFASGTGWTLAATHTISGGKLIAAANTKPQYISDTGFETGTGWTDSIGPVTRPMSDDIDIVNDAGNAKDGSYVMAVGPITQHQVFANADFGSGLTNWYMSSTDADPHTVWETDATEGNNGTACIRTTGWSTAGRTGPETIKYLRADSVAGGGVNTYDVAPGESYTAEAYFKAAPGTEGQPEVSLMIPHPTVPGHDLWFHSAPKLDGVDMDDLRWARVTIENVTIPTNRFVINGLVEVHNHGLGYWYVDTFTLTRTRGNRAQIHSDATYSVSADNTYELAADMRSGGEMQVGSVRVGVILSGSGLDDEIVDVDKGSTDYEWTRVRVQVKPRAGYTTARPFVAGLDIVGEPAYIDNISFTKVDNNSATSTHTSFAVTPDQRYLLSADVASLGATRGTITVGVTLTGAGVTTTDVEVSQGLGDGTAKAISTEVRPPPGYTTATPFVRSTDIEGGTFTVDALRLVKMDNNSDSSAGTAIAVTPERTYRWTQATKSGTGLARGTVKLSVTCQRAGYADVVFDSSPMEATAGAWKFIDFSFTPPSGYNTIVPRIVGTDVEGDYWYLDDGELRDTDTATMVFDTTSDNPTAASPYVDTTAPAGAETVRVAVILEQGTTSVTLNSVSLARTGVTPATAAAIVADLLEHPQTGDPLSIDAGTITAPDVIPYDVVIQNRTNRDTLDYLCNVLADPPLEYRVLPTDPPTIDVGPAATVFDTHSPADALLPEDLDVEEMSDPVTDIADRPTEVTVVGAELQKVSGGTFLVTATAQVPGAARYDLNGNPMVRTKYVHDGTVDHLGYAQALADDLAAREAEPALVLTAKLSGKDTRADSPPGDTIYAYKPDAGVEDLDLADPPMINGQLVRPRALRVHQRERAHGPSHRIVMRGPGVEFPLTGVRWSEEDATVLTIGDRFAPWDADPQGLSAGEQYARDRKSKPR